MHTGFRNPGLLDGRYDLFQALGYEGDVVVVDHVIGASTLCEIQAVNGLEAAGESAECENYELIAGGGGEIVDQHDIQNACQGELSDDINLVVTIVEDRVPGPGSQSSNFNLDAAQ